MNRETHLGKTVGVILGAGKGTRMSSRPELKQFQSLEGKPIFLYSVEAFDACQSVDEIVVVVPPGMTAKMRSILDGRSLRVPLRIIVGGKRRQDSSYKALHLLSRKGDVSVVAIHDAARPLISPEIIESAVREAKTHGAAAVATKTTDTVLDTEDGFIVSIPNRDSLFNAQTPQVFALELIWQAHQAARRDGLFDASDDVQLVLRLGKKVKLVESPPENIKITTDRDLDLAALIMRERRGRSRRVQRETAV
jgi:2-C-methyl-D-erythritol 4-phosphate cytidylyltransferase